jgi:hypothetical protein
MMVETMMELGVSHRQACKETGLARSTGAYKQKAKTDEALQAITIYNNEKRHCSLQMETPAFAHRYQKHDYKFYKKLIA